MGLQVQWPVGLGGKGNEGVTAKVQQTAGGIGYVEQGYADDNHLPYGAIQNKDGNFVKASPETVSWPGRARSRRCTGTCCRPTSGTSPAKRPIPSLPSRI